MGNMKSMDRGDDLYVEDTDPNEAVNKKIASKPQVQTSLDKMKKNPLDLGTKEGLLKTYLLYNDTLTYVEPQINDIIRQELAVKEEMDAGVEDPNIEQVESPAAPFTSKSTYTPASIHTSSPHSPQSHGGMGSKRPHLKIKLVITELPDNKKERKVLSPILSTLNLSPQFGLFHSALIIGPWKIEWNDSELVIPRRCMASAVLAFDVHEFTGEEKVKDTLGKLAEVISKYNVNGQYDQLNCNCQRFVDDVLKQLGIELKFTGQLDAFLKELKRTGRCESKYKVPDQFLDALKQHTFKSELKVDENGIVKFDTHEQLDEFVHKMESLSARYFYFDGGANDFKLLKAFDRALWLRHFKHKIEKKSSNPQYKPSACCPFGDPTQTATNMKS
ncbi:structural maintenance of chromosomes protein [Acrasis kona]|uniref:Structural maintenance of chromosomes protein n=1 Tax=Acrasis kona TaxID=1008807 RepID=A0AAW2YWG1_9EUKA